MDDDIVDRLRNYKWWEDGLEIEAAAEIERLRAALKLAQNLDEPLLLEIERLRAENERLRAALRSVFEAKASIATGITFRDDGAANLWLSMWTEAAAAISTTPASEGASND